MVSSWGSSWGTSWGSSWTLSGGSQPDPGEGCFIQLKNGGLILKKSGDGYLLLKNCEDNAVADYYSGKARRKRWVVKIDGQLLEFSSAQKAQQYLESLEEPEAPVTKKAIKVEYKGVDIATQEVQQTSGLQVFIEDNRPKLRALMAAITAQLKREEELRIHAAYIAELEAEEEAAALIIMAL